MKLKYLGTAAAEGIPAIFCHCDICKQARNLGGKNIRTRSQALIDDTILLDFCPDTYMHFLHGGLDLLKIKDCIVTHSHADHLYAAEFTYLYPGFTPNNPEFTFHVYATQPGVDLINEAVEGHAKNCKKKCLEAKKITPFESFQIDDYKITPLKADHDPRTDPVIFMIEREGKTMLYANDTGYFTDETWEFLREKIPCFDLISYDCTGAFLTGNNQCYKKTHMNWLTVLNVRDTLTKIGCVNEKTLHIIHHFSHNGLANHDDLEKAAKIKNFLVAFDGMEIKF